MVDKILQGAGNMLTPNKATASSGANAAAASEAVRKYVLSPEECEELFGSSEPVASLDIYLVDRCDQSSVVKIPASAMTADGVSFSYAFEGDVQTSASPSSDYYRMSNASVNITFTVRLASIMDNIRSMVLPGRVESANGKSRQVIDRSMLRRRPRSFVLLGVAEDEPPSPEQAQGGSLLFGNVSIDFSQNIDLNYNPNDPIEIAVSMVARFTKGIDGILGEMYY
jgi:hypothetical protein